MDVIDQLRDAADAASLSVPEIASRAGISRAAAYRIFDRSTSPRLDDLHELFIAAGVDFDLKTSPVHDLDASAAARTILRGQTGDAMPSIAAWVERLDRVGGGDPVATVQAAGLASSVLRDPDAVGLRADTWSVDRLVSAGRASERLWALSGWAALSAMGHTVDAQTILWTEDTRLIRQLLADTMTLTSVTDADIILSRGDAHIFEHTADIEAVILVDPLQALIDSVGLGGIAESFALNLIRSVP